jgi:hypothetical protein
MERFPAEAWLMTDKAERKDEEATASPCRGACRYTRVKCVARVSVRALGSVKRFRTTSDRSNGAPDT